MKQSLTRKKNWRISFLEDLQYVDLERVSRDLSLTLPRIQYPPEMEIEANDSELVQHCKNTYFAVRAVGKTIGGEFAYWNSAGATYVEISRRRQTRQTTGRSQLRSVRLRHMGIHQTVTSKHKFTPTKHQNPAWLVSAFVRDKNTSPTKTTLPAAETLPWQVKHFSFEAEHSGTEPPETEHFWNRTFCFRRFCFKWFCFRSLCFGSFRTKTF